MIAKQRILLIPMIVVFFASCTSQKKLTYMNDIGMEADSLYAISKGEYQIQPADLLYIKITTEDPEVNQLFNPDFAQAGSSINIQSGNLYLLGYEVNDSGFVQLPVLKEVYLQGLTIRQAKDTIYKKAKIQLREPQVTIKLHSFQYTILGEVNIPGLKTIGSFDLNILEAVALAGDITYNGNRENIVLLRPGQEGFEIHRLDLTDKKIIGSDYFFVQPNDIIYVEPLRRTIFRESTADYMFFVSSLSTIISLVALILSLKK